METVTALAAAIFIALTLPLLRVDNRKSQRNEKCL